ncbi:MAG: hypothetical protein WBA39_16265 [Rivularia sp. (in: cyanobacteria)]
MNNIFIINFLTGLTILFSLIIFHRITFYIFTPALDFFDKLFFSDKRKTLFHEIERNPAFILGYIISISTEFLIGTFSILLRNILGFVTTINDVILISLIPALIIYLLIFIIGLIQNYIDPSLKKYQISIYPTDIRLLLANTIIIFFGGLTSLLLIRVFN